MERKQMQIKLSSAERRIVALAALAAHLPLATWIRTTIIVAAENVLRADESRLDYAIHVSAHRAAMLKLKKDKANASRHES